MPFHVTKKCFAHLIPSSPCTITVRVTFLITVSQRFNDATFMVMQYFVLALKLNILNLEYIREDWRSIIYDLS